MRIPGTLAERIQNRRIIPFAGAGVSIAVKKKPTDENLFPNWKTLLHRAADKLDGEQKGAYAGVVRSLLEIDTPDFLEAAKRAKAGLGPIWYDFLKEQFDHSRGVIDDTSLGLAKSLWSLGSQLVITTNYDRVLRWACPRSDDVSIWNIEAPAEQAAALRDGVNRPVVWHLHGTIDDAANIILTPDAYERLYPNENSKASFTAAIQALRATLSSYSFLFVGFSLSDQFFGSQLKSINDVFSGATGPHYALMLSNGASTANPPNLPGIEIINFPNSESLLEAIHELSKMIPSEQAEGPASTAIIPTTPVNCSPIPLFASSEHTNSCDVPPPALNWVGREAELEILHGADSKVVAITGIGGQGKSTLAAKYLSQIDTQDSFWDWRDCKEESNTLHTHIVRSCLKTVKA